MVNTAHRNIRLRNTVLIASVLLGSSAVGGPPEPTTASSDDAPNDLSTLLLHVANAYCSAKSVHEKSQVLVPDEMRRILGSSRMSMEYWYEKPNKLRVKSPLYDLACDGKQQLIYIKKLRQHILDVAPERFGREWFTKEPILQLGLPDTLVLTAMLNAESDSGRLTHIEELMAHARFDAAHDAIIRRRPCVAVGTDKLLSHPQFSVARVLIDRENFTALRILVPEKGSGNDKWTTLLDVLKRECEAPISPTLFVVREPSGSKRVQHFQAMPAATKRPPGRGH